LVCRTTWVLESRLFGWDDFDRVSLFLAMTRNYVKFGRGTKK